jgi:hypothetical protein
MIRHIFSLPFLYAFGCLPPLLPLMPLADISLLFLLSFLLIDFFAFICFDGHFHASPPLPPFSFSFSLSLISAIFTPFHYAFRRYFSH